MQFPQQHRILPRTTLGNTPHACRDNLYAFPVPRILFVLYVFREIWDQVARRAYSSFNTNRTFMLTRWGQNNIPLCFPNVATMSQGFSGNEVSPSGSAGCRRAGSGKKSFGILQRIMRQHIKGIPDDLKGSFRECSQRDP